LSHTSLGFGRRDPMGADRESLPKKPEGSKGTLHRLRLSALFWACGVSVFIAPEFMPRGIQTTYVIGLPVLFLVSAVLLRRNKHLARYFQVFFAFSVASAAYAHYLLLGVLFSIPIGSIPSTINGMVLHKLLSTLLVVVPIVLLTGISGKDMASIYLKKGKLRLGVIIGFATFLLFLVTSVETSMLLFGGRNLSFERVASWSPWILAFVLANGLREELWFRGLFLRKYESLLGADSSNLVQALVFPMAHLGAGYTTSLPVFLVIVFLLGLAFGAVMQKTDSVLGSILFHAGTDVPVVLGYFSNPLVTP